MSQTFQTFSCNTNTLNHKTELFSENTSKFADFSLARILLQVLCGALKWNKSCEKGMKRKSFDEWKEFSLFFAFQLGKPFRGKATIRSISFCWMATAGSALYEQPFVEEASIGWIRVCVERHKCAVGETNGTSFCSARFRGVNLVPLVLEKFVGDKTLGSINFRFENHYVLKAKRRL